jgi:hypothetical protein
MPTRQPASFNATFSRIAPLRAACVQLGGATREKPSSLKILQQVQNDPAALRARGKNGRKKVEAEYGMGQIAAAYEQLYLQLLRRSSGASG